MASFTIRWQREPLVWKRVVRYGFRFSKTFKTTEYPEHTEYAGRTTGEGVRLGSAGVRLRYNIVTFTSSVYVGGLR